jgi:glycine cleavage system H protein
MMKRFSEDHEWVEWDNGIATIGITAYAAEEMGDITFVELPEKGVVFAQGDSLCVVESVKAAADVFAPVGGTVAQVNQRLDESPGLINTSPEKEGWICRLVEVDESELDSLMTEEQYEQFLEEGAEE